MYNGNTRVKEKYNQKDHLKKQWPKFDFKKKLIYISRKIKKKKFR